MTRISIILVIISILAGAAFFVWQSHCAEQDAAATIERIQRLEAQYLYALNRVGKNDDEAITLFKGIIAEDPNFQRARAQLGILYKQKSLAKWAKYEHEAAIADLTEAIKLDPDRSVDYLKTRGSQRMSLSTYKEALEDYSKAIQLSPNDSDAYRTRAAIHEMLEDKAACRRDLLAWKRLTEAADPSIEVHVGDTWNDTVIHCRTGEHKAH